MRTHIKSYQHFISHHKVLSLFILLGLVSIVAMAMTGTLSYPYILVARQIQTIRDCTFGSNEFSTTDYGFHFQVPNGYCFLPHQTFPLDGSAQIVPKALYSVLNEYIKGNIIAASEATVLFEPVVPGRSPSEVLTTLSRGGFLRDAEVSNFTNQYGIQMTIVKNALGLDGIKHYTWAFFLHPNGKIFLSVLTSRPDDPRVFQYILNNTSSL